jgi:DNA-binding NarL/FixJ family response regulator
VRSYNARQQLDKDVTCRPCLLLADDHLETAELLRALLEAEFDVIACVRDGHALVSVAERLSPDVIVSDISMPGLDGIAAASVILARNPAARIILVTVHGDPILVQCGLAAGALGYVLKEAAGEDLIPAVRAALRGERHVSRALLFTDGTTPPSSR